MSSLSSNLKYIKEKFHDSEDLTIHELKLGSSDAAVISIDNLISKDILAVGIMRPLLTCATCGSPIQRIRQIQDSILYTDDITEITTFEELSGFILSGFAVIALDGCPTMLSIGIQGFKTRGISEPDSDIVQRGSKEGFVEQLRTNISMLRRRMKTPDLRVEIMKIGRLSGTEVGICYLSGTASEKIVSDIKSRLEEADLDTVLASGYLVPFLEGGHHPSPFSTVGITERPDTVCGKMAEGRVAIIVDGVPSALIAPSLFAEYFQTLDDYSNKPYFAAFTRWLKYAAFLISMLLPGIYVSLGTYDPEMFPSLLLNKLAWSIASTPLSLAAETLMILFIYEILRESGLRMPQPLGYAVSIVGGLVIGDTAVNAGLIGAPTLMVVAMAAICSYIIPDLYAPCAILRLLFTIAGGICGIWGVSLLFCVVFVNLCSLSSFGVPYTAPISPTGAGLFRDVLLRADWRILSLHNERVQDMPGAEPSGGDKS